MANDIDLWYLLILNELITRDTFDSFVEIDNKEKRMEFLSILKRFLMTRILIRLKN